SDGQIVYAARGNKTGDFYSYRVADSAWTALTAIPNGSEGRPPYKGAVGVCDDQSNVYATKGNSTRGFWRYGTDSNWTQLPDVPLGSSRKAVKGGTDLVYVVENETGYVYLLKGYKQDFFRFNTVSGVWDTHLPPAPAGARPKWDRGSWVAFNPQPEPPADPSIYAHKAKYHELWAFSVTTHTWGTAALPGMPLVGRMGKSKKSKDGGCGAYYSGALYALKGGNTQEFWQYTIAGGAWTELDTMPSFGSTGKKKRVKAGGDIVSFGGGVFFALKGNKTLEFWRYASDALPASTGAPYRGGASARPAARSGPAAPAGTVSAGRLRLQLSGSGPVTVRLFDVTGRTALSRTLVTRNSSLDIDVSGLSAGVYLARVEEPGRAAACKLVIR
ncbi:T9SS type A sorting domain-containing protein, partial [candidate division WOR-3 bacterium]|nr:T9SS type A sorting domain-containing protein [candidate division WOR-3 bacterium]